MKALAPHVHDTEVVVDHSTAIIAEIHDVIARIVKDHYYYIETEAVPVHDTEVVPTPRPIIFIRSHADLIEHGFISRPCIETTATMKKENDEGDTITFPEPIDRDARQWNKQQLAARGSGKPTIGRKPPDAQHKAVAFQTGDRIVRKRAYFRWCKRRGLDAFDMENVRNFKRRKQFEKDERKITGPK